MTEEIFQKYRLGDQSHVLKFWDELSESQRSDFLEDLGQYDVARLNTFFKSSVVPESKKEVKITPPKSEMIVNLTPEERKKYFSLGLNLVRDGKIGAIILAGGQGTRLKFNKSKALFPFTELPSKKTLLQIQLERVLCLERLSEAKKKMQVYVMTSQTTEQDIVDYLKESDYFGLSADQVHVFRQAGYPCFDLEGKFLLAEKNKLTFAPNGNGAMYEALRVSGMLDNMKDRGVDYVHMVAVDNIIVRVGDPTFVAKCAEMGADFGSKVIPKREPHERVGVFGLKDGKVCVVEYSEITKEMAEMRKDDGSLRFNESNIVNFFFARPFLDKCGRMKMDKHHVAKKDIPCINENGEQCVAKGIKLELFNFDVCEYTDKVCLFYGSRMQDFSPLKNAEGKDSPKTCIRDLSKLHIKYLQDAGAKFEVEEDEEKRICEISPLVSYQGENLDVFRGQTLKFPTHIKK